MLAAFHGGHGHIGQTGGAIVGHRIPARTVLVVDAERVIPWRHGFHLAIAVRHFHRAAKEVGIGHVKRAFGAVKLKVVAAVVPDIPRG